MTYDLCKYSINIPQPYLISFLLFGQRLNDSKVVIAAAVIVLVVAALVSLDETVLECRLEGATEGGQERVGVGDDVAGGRVDAAERDRISAREDKHSTVYMYVLGG